MKNRIREYMEKEGLTNEELANILNSGTDFNWTPGFVEYVINEQDMVFTKKDRDVMIDYFECEYEDLFPSE